jgi:hypothetical protein
MKLNIALASLVASVALCSQSFGFDLLDRMLGGSGCGCEVSCCETAASCCDADPSCGCNAVDPSCGCNAVDPSCGADACDPCATSCGRKPLIQINLPKIKLIQINRCKPACDPCCDADPSCGCNTVDPSCGADPSCGCETTSCCGRKGLLDRIFARKLIRGSSCCDMGCEAAPCGCGSTSSDAAPADAPAPPAPVVDPAAFSAPARVIASR